MSEQRLKVKLVIPHPINEQARALEFDIPEDWYYMDMGDGWDSEVIEDLIDEFSKALLGVFKPEAGARVEVMKEEVNVKVEVIEVEVEE